MGQMVGYVDLSTLSKDMAAASGQSFKTTTRKVVASAISQIDLLASQYAPKRTGALAGSITAYTINNGMGGVVSAKKSYASYVEFGTLTRGEFKKPAVIIKPKNGKFLKFPGSGGKTVYAKQVKALGMAPRPFLRPAFERVISPMVEHLGKEAGLAIVKGPNRPETLLSAPATGVGR